MDYQAKLPEHNDNISHEHPLKEFAVLLCGVSVICALVYGLLGLLIDVAVERISPETEQAWFQQSSINAMVKQSVGESVRAAQISPQLFADLKSCAHVHYPLRLWQVESELANSWWRYSRIRWFVECGG